MNKLFTIKHLLYLIFIFATSYSEAQTQSWLSRFNGSSNQTDEARVMTLNARGNSYVSGTGYTISGGEDIAIVKYDINGNQAWVDTFGTTGIDWANDITVDGSGDVFVTGYVTDFTDGSLVVYKFDSSGVQQWVRYFGSPGSVQDNGMAITCDENYVYVTGATIATTFPPYRDFITAKYDILTGTMQSGWPKRYNGTGNNEDFPTSIAVDTAGKVYVTGWSTNASGDKDWVTIVYGPNGSVLSGWPQIFDGPLNLWDYPVQLLLSGSNIVVTGRCNATSTNSDYGDLCTIMYNSSGGIVSGWPRIYNGTGNTSDGEGSTANDASYKPMAVDAAGNVYVTGWTTNADTNYDMITFKFNSAGVIQPGWPQIYDNGGKDDISRGLALDSVGNVYITGFSAPAHTFTNGDYVTIAYTNSGIREPGWPVIYNGPAAGDDEAQAIRALGQCVWVTGFSAGSGTFADYTTIKYCNLSTAVSDVSKLNTSDALDVWPNPSSGIFTLHNSEGGRLIITNTLGEIIYRAEILSSSVQIDLSKESSGVYFLQLSKDGWFATSKLMKQ